MIVIKEIYDRCVSIFGNIFFWMGLLGIIIAIYYSIRLHHMGRRRPMTVRSSARKIAIVTGASGGLGRGYVKALASQMKEFDIDEFWIIARRREALQELSDEIGVPCLIMPLDLMNGRSFDVIKEMLSSRDYSVRLLINCAGMGLSGTSAEIGNRGEQMEIVLNDSATVAMVQICLPYMSAGSRIVNISSIAAFQSLRGFSVYSASKAFVLSYTRGLRQELAGLGISVTAVCPYWVRDTGFIEHSTGKSSSPFMSSTTSRVVRSSLRAIKHRWMISTPSIVSFLDFVLGRLFPDDVLSKAAGVLNLKRKK